MKPDPKSFKKPNGWATYCEERTTKFKTHSSLGMCKTAIAGMSVSNLARRGADGHLEYAVLGDAWVYRFNPDLDEWQEMYHLPAGTYRSDHELWKEKIKGGRLAKSLPQEEVDAAIASIINGSSK